MRFFCWLTLLWIALAFPLAAQPLTPDEIAEKVLAPLLDPARIAMLKGDRPVNSRLYKIMGWLETARLAGGEIEPLIHAAQEKTDDPKAMHARAVRAALLQSWKRLDQFGCFTAEGIATMRKGASPLITKGKHTGDKVHLDHILPRSVVPELDARFYNLIPVPSRQNLRKGAKVTGRQLVLGLRWHRQHLLSDEGMEGLEQAGRGDVVRLAPEAVGVK